VVTVRPSPPAPQTQSAPVQPSGNKPESSADEETRVSRPPKHE
jgi:hypothetical protein